MSGPEHKSTPGAVSTPAANRQGLNRDWNWSEVPPPRRAFPLISDQAGRLGTLDQAIGAEAAEAFFAEPDPFDDARRAAAEILGRLGNA
jgi:hypothetical protein